MEVEINEIIVSLPRSTINRLHKYQQASNGQFDNCVSRAINDGIDAVQLLHPNIRDEMGEDEPHRMTVAARLCAEARAKNEAEGQEE